MSSSIPPATHPISYLRLPSAPSIPLAYTFIPGTSPAPSTSALSPPAPAPLVVFLNGLALPSTSWHAVLTLLTSQTSHPPLLCYDRYGQGSSSALPSTSPSSSSSAADPTHAHDVASLVPILHELITTLSSSEHHPDIQVNVRKSGVLLVTNSLGGAIARLYCAAHPAIVAGIVFLDSVIANTDFVSVFPDPELPDFREDDLPAGVTAKDLTDTRAKVARIFSPDVGSREGTSRRNLKELLPMADGPTLHGFGGARPWVTVVGHGFERFAQEGLEGMGIPPLITKTYTNPYWHLYNVGLTKLTAPERSKGPIEAVNCGHFIQRDDAALVARLVGEMLEDMR